MTPALVVEGDDHAQARIDFHLGRRIPEILIGPAAELDLRILRPDASGDFIDHVPVAVGCGALGSGHGGIVQRIALRTLAPDRSIVVPDRHISVRAVFDVDSPIKIVRHVIQQRRIADAGIRRLGGKDHDAFAADQREVFRMFGIKLFHVLPDCPAVPAAEQIAENMRIAVGGDTFDRQTFIEIRVRSPFSRPGIVKGRGTGGRLHVVADHPLVCLDIRRHIGTDPEIRIGHLLPVRHGNRPFFRKVGPVVSGDEETHAAMAFENLVTAVKRSPGIPPDHINAVSPRGDGESLLLQIPGRDSGLLHKPRIRSCPDENRIAPRNGPFRDGRRSPACDLPQKARQFRRAEAQRRRGVFFHDNDGTGFPVPYQINVRGTDPSGCRQRGTRNDRKSFHPQSFP